MDKIIREISWMCKFGGIVLFFCIFIIGLKVDVIKKLVETKPVATIATSVSPYDFMSFDEYCHSLGVDGTILGYSMTDTEAKQVLCVVPAQGVNETDVLRNGRVEFTGPVEGDGVPYDDNRAVALATSKDDWQPLGYAHVDDSIKKMCKDNSKLLAIDKIRTVTETEDGQGTIIGYGSPYCYNSETRLLVYYDGSTANVIRTWPNFTPIR